MHHCQLEITLSWQTLVAFARAETDAENCCVSSKSTYCKNLRKTTRDSSNAIYNRNIEFFSMLVGAHALDILLHSPYHVVTWFCARKCTVLWHLKTRSSISAMDREKIIAGRGRHSINCKAALTMIYIKSKLKNILTKHLPGNANFI